MENECKWYAVYTKPRWEKKVAELLTLKNVENYCPLHKVQRQWSDRKKIVHEPVFKSYVFVRISKNGYLHVVRTDGILNFVNYLGKPAVIRDEEIEVVRKFLSEYQNVRAEKVDLRINDEVRVKSGPLMLRTGVVVEIKNRTAKVSLPTLGYTLVAEIEKSNLEKNTTL